MLTWLALVRMEVLSRVRALVPCSWLRRLALGALAALVIVECGAALLMPLSPQRAATGVGALAGLLVANLAVAVALAAGAAAQLLRQPQAARVGLHAPVSQASVIWSHIVAILTLTVPGLVLFYAPIVIGVSRVAPRLALLMVALGFATAAWSVQIALWLGVQFARRLGRERGSKLLQTAALSLGAAAVLSFASLLRASKGPEPIAIYLAATLSVLPFWMRATARAFASVMTVAEPPSYACAPRWGRPSWWSLLRTRPIFVGLPAALSIAGLHFAGAPIRSGASASILVLVALAPLGRLLTAEYERPERWRLAPLARRMRWSALTWVGLPCALTSTIAAVIIGWANLRWQVALTVLSFLGPLSCLIFSSLPRHLVQAALVMGALATGALL